MAFRRIAAVQSGFRRTKVEKSVLRLACTAFMGLGFAWGCSSDNSAGTQVGGPDSGVSTGGVSGAFSGGAPGTGGMATGGVGTGGLGTGGLGTGGLGTGGLGTGGLGTGGLGTGGLGTGGSGGVPTCDPATLSCRPGLCADAGAPCTTSTDCCTLRCEGSVCQAAQCVSDHQSCASNEECCSGTCSGGSCAALNPLCATAGNSCTQSTECCSQYCKDGVCNIAPSWCIQTGDLCSYSEDCCSGTCVFASGRTSGTCGEPPTGSGCTGKAIEGSVCAGFNDCASCCSKLCAPDPASGVFVCQPTSGCRTEGGLCRVDTDCCGVAGTGLPGDGNGVCERDPGSPVGVCKTNSCIPQGQVCHYDGLLYVCDSGTSDPNSCCSATGSSGRCIADSMGVLRCNGFAECPPGSQADDQCSLCMLDELGIPRCNGLAACRQAGETCSNSADCCDGLPCTPDAQGVLRCLPAGQCVTDSGSCTVDADCCVSLICIKPPGSIAGTCAPLNPTPEPPDASTPPPEDAATPPPTCAAYGQMCTVNTDCCNYDPANTQFGCFGGVCVYSIR